MDDLLKDKRFSHISKDARFKKIPRREKKVKIDKRFQSMFSDERFQLKSVVDKRGRPLISRGSEHLERFYDLSDESSDEDDTVKPSEENHIETDDESTEGTDTIKNNDHSENVFEGTKLKSKHLPPEIKAKLKDLTVDYARGEGRIFSDSSSDEDSSSADEEDEEVQHAWGELDKDAVTTDEATVRLAVCHMDWDRITAQDLWVLFNSFLPSGGLLNSVTIFPSDFGLKRMEEEEKKGPTELTALSSTVDKEEEDTLTHDQREKLREYQLKRLRYYYAVLVFDSPRTANHVYKECDGLEYESSMNRLDLRFIPDDTTFEQEPREKCTEMPDLTIYKPRLYRTTALTQVKVDLTWDETDQTRQELIRAAHEGKLDESGLERFLAASSSDDDDGEEDDNDKPVLNNEPPTSEKKAIMKYKELLAGLEKTEETKKQDVAMEVTWDLKLEQKTAEKVKEITKVQENQTPFEKFLEKKKEKRKLKKEQKMVKSEGGVEEENDEPFSDDDIPSDIDMNDPYFKEEIDKMKQKKKGKNKKSKGIIAENSEEDNKNSKAELELLMMDEKDKGSKHHFNLKELEENEKTSKRKKKLKKRKGEVPKETDDNFQLDVKDERFSAIYTSHLYNVDPAEAQFRPTDGMKALIAEKARRRLSPEPESRTQKSAEKRKIDGELSLLVKSVQRKTQEIKKKKTSK